VSIGGAEVIARPPAEPLAAGDAVKVLVRHAWAEAPGQPAADGRNQVPVRIRVTAQVGEVQETDCTVGDEHVRVISDRRLSASVPTAAGSEAVLCFDADDAQVLPDAQTLPFTSAIKVP